MMRENTERVFLVLLKAGLWEGVKVQGEGLMVNGFPLSIDDDVDWSKVLDLAEEQSVVGLLAAGIEVVQGSWLKVHGAPWVPKPMALQFVGRTMQLEQRNQAMNYFIGVLVDKMREAGIETVLVKGQGVAQCYERPLWRSCGDVDFLLDEENFDKALEYLAPLAQHVDRAESYSHHIGMTIDPWVVELHGSLRCGLSPKMDKVIDELQAESCGNGNVRIWKDGGTEVLLPEVNNDILFIFTHFLKHFYKGGIGLRQICDWCRLLWKYRDTLDVTKVETLVRRMGLVSEWRAFAALAVNDLGMPAEAMPMYDNAAKWSRKAERIKAFVLSVGNFGHNRDMNYYNKYPFLVRKCISMGQRVGDLLNHARIFPIDSLRFFPSMLVNGVRSVVNGEE
jgi:hypothetical protein